MPFRVKNITNYPVTIFGTPINPEKKLDLLTVESVANVKASIINGVLYDLLMGRSLSILNPYEDVPYLGLSTDEYSRLASAGFFKGLLGTEHLLHPLQFSSDGYLLTSATIGSITVESQSEVEGRVFDGEDGTGIKPVIVSGIDNDGYSQSVSVNADGYIFIANTASSTYGPVADGSAAYGYPVEVGGVDASGNVQSLLVDTDGYLMTSTAISIETNSEVEGRVADGADATGIKPVIVSGVDEDGYSQFMLVSSSGELTVRGYDAPADAVRIFETAPVNASFLLETLVNATNQSVDTYYYLITMDNYRDVSFEMEVSTNVVVTIECSNDSLFSVPKDITKSGNDIITNSNGYTSFTNVNAVLDFDNINVSYIRVKAVVSNATNTVKIVSRKKAL